MCGNGLRSSKNRKYILVATLFSVNPLPNMAFQQLATFTKFWTDFYTAVRNEHGMAGKH